MVTNMRENEPVDSESGVASQLEELGHVWDRVTTLSQVRESRLHDALKLVRIRVHAYAPVNDSSL